MSEVILLVAFWPSPVDALALRRVQLPSGAIASQKPRC
jgi:hypothetical protein